MVADDQAQIIGVLEFYFKVFALRIHTRLLTNCIDVYNVNGTFGLKWIYFLENYTQLTKCTKALSLIKKYTCLVDWTKLILETDSVFIL